MRDRDNRTRTGAKDPWGREAGPLAQRHVEASTDLDSGPGDSGTRQRAKGSSKRTDVAGMPGTGFTAAARREALSDMLALKPYWGKPAVRNFRESDGDVGIIRSPVRAIALPDPGSCSEFALRGSRGDAAVGERRTTNKERRTANRT